MSEDNEVFNDQEIAESTEAQATETGEQTEASSSEQQQEQKIFTQSDIDNVVEKRLARHKESNEALQQRLDQLTSMFQNFGKPQDAQQPQQPVFDPSKPITYEDLMHMQAQEEQGKKTEHFNKMAESTTQKYADFKDKTKGHAFTKAVMGNPNLANALEALSDPFEFMYLGATEHSEALEKIAAIQDPHKQFAEIVRLEAKMNQSAKVPGVSQAPGIVGEDHEGSSSNATGGDIQDLRKQLTAGR